MTFSEWASNAMTLATPVIKTLLDFATGFLEVSIQIQRAWAWVFGFKLPDIGKATTGKQREEEIKAMGERVAQQQKEMDAEKAIREQAKAAADEQKKQIRGQVEQYW